MNSPCAVQIVVDCTSPHVLADWWAETLGWEVEAQDEAFIRSMIDQGFASEADTERHAGSLVWSTAAAINAPGQPGAGQPRVLFQHVPEPKSLKNRLHFDIRLAADEPHEQMHARLVERGAVALGGGQQGPHRWVTYADPEGNEFCVDA